MRMRGENIIHHVSDLADIISTDKIPADNPLKLHAVSYLQGYIRQVFKERLVENSEL